MILQPIQPLLDCESNTKNREIIIQLLGPEQRVKRYKIVSHHFLSVFSEALNKMENCSSEWNENWNEDGTCYKENISNIVINFYFMRSL